LPRSVVPLSTDRPGPPVDKAGRLSVLFCSAGFLGIAATVVVVVVKFLL
jgi:hypothetical protein